MKREEENSYRWSSPKESSNRGASPKGSYPFPLM